MRSFEEGSGENRSMFEVECRISKLKQNNGGRTGDLVDESPYSPSRVGGLDVPCDNFLLAFLCNSPCVRSADDVVVLVFYD